MPSAEKLLLTVSRHSMLTACIPVLVLAHALVNAPWPPDSPAMLLLAVPLLAWSFAASALTARAGRRYDQFESEVCLALDRPDLGTRALVCTCRVLPGVAFSIVGFLAVVGLRDGSATSYFVLLTVVVSFYYAGIALWASHEATCNGQAIVHRLVECGAIDPNKSDDLCGLGTVRDLADSVSWHILSGFAALPLGVSIVREHARAWADAAPGSDTKVMRLVFAGVGVIAIGSWLWFTLWPTLRIRLDISHALRIEKRRRLIDLDRQLASVRGDDDAVARINAERRVWIRVRTGVLGAVHGWRDVAQTVGALILGVAANGFSKAIGL